MRILLFILAISFTTCVYTQQISSGTIVYHLTVKNNDSSSESREEYLFTAKFNDRYLWYKSEKGDNEGNNWNLEDKTTGINTYYLRDPEEHFVQFEQEKPEDRKAREEERIKYEDPYYDEEKPDLDTYHDDFYKDLLKLEIPVKDTIVEKTDETKDIMGFMCKKTILKIKGKTTIIAWHTDEITGVEGVFDLESYIKGTILSFYIENDFFIVQLDATEVSRTNDLEEKDLFTIPKDYKLGLYTLYLGNFEEITAADIETKLEIPDFVKFPEAGVTIRNIITEIGEAIHFKTDDYFYANVKATIIFGKDGTISSVVFEDDDETMAAQNTFDRKQLAKDIQKNYKLKEPVTFNGEPVPVLIKIDYSHYKEN